MPLPPPQRVWIINITLLFLGLRGGGGGRGEEGSPIKYLYGQMLLNGGNDVRTPDLECRGKNRMTVFQDSVAKHLPTNPQLNKKGCSPINFVQQQ